MVKFLGISVVAPNVLLANWWNKLLLAVLVLTFLIAVSYLCYRVYGFVQEKRAYRRNHPRVPQSVVDTLKEHQLPRIGCSREGNGSPAKSFGVYLGSFDGPPTQSQERLLSSWDVVVLDPSRDGVLPAVKLMCNSQHVLGRFDIDKIVGDASLKNKEDVRIKLSTFITIVVSQLVATDAPTSPFTGIVLANWRSHFQPMAFSALIRFFDSLSLDVNLELSGPSFLTEDECRLLDLEKVKGIICCNGTILPNGDRRDYFQMTDMRRALRAFAQHSQTSEGRVMMCETIGDGVPLEHGILRRSYNWCRYYSALSWIAPQSALLDSRVAVEHTVAGEPLGALAFLKEDAVVKLQEIWKTNDRISRRSNIDLATYGPLNAFIPGLAGKLSPTSDSCACQEHEQNSEITYSIAELNLPLPTLSQDTFDISPHGDVYTGFGCFALGLDGTQDDFEELVTAQRRLKGLDLLQPLNPKALQNVGDQLQVLSRSGNSLLRYDNTVKKAIQDLAVLLAGNYMVEDPQRLQVYTGLRSGFRKDSSCQFWGIYDVDELSDDLNIFIPSTVTDLAGVILHTFLSSRKLTRTQCLMAEMALAEENGTLSQRWGLPERFVQDILMLTPTELLLLLQKIKSADPKELPTLAERIRQCCEYQLLEAPTLTQLRKENSTAYLRGEIEVQDLISSRIIWYQSQGCQHPSAVAATILFEEVNTGLLRALMNQDSQALSLVRKALTTMISPGEIDAAADLFALAVFCAIRKLAIVEIYLEVLDRNPLPNPQSDQASCFAEMFALGSRCEAYFDMTPNEFGRILAKRYDSYYKLHQPPMRDDLTTEVPTAYASKQVDLNIYAKAEKLPMYYQVTFLGMFAFPALIDILLLTTIGRGLYLSTYMSQDEKSTATTALMVALFLTGGIGTWIGSGGSYYLHAMAYPAMNMFVMTRWVAGIAVCCGCGILGFIIIAAVKGPYSGFIFLFYLVLLTTYLSTLATMAIYQLPGFMFQSGRMTVAACIPLLFISPILTLFIDHDIIVYLCVLSGFVVTLLMGARRVLAKWSSWYLDIPFVSDGDIAKWYSEREKSQAESLLSPEIDVLTTPIPRRTLLDCVERELKRPFWAKPTDDKFVRKVTDGYAATKFLMAWYCKYSRTEMPFPYSTTWNLQCKAAADTLKSMQKGLRLHNAFMHWRHSGDEVYCGVLYFVIALMDKWIALMTGGSLVGLSAADSVQFRLPIGFSLAYYLISAIFLDAVAHPLWARANKIDPIPVGSLNLLRKVEREGKSRRRRLYWTNLTKFAMLHVWALVVTSALMWLFEDSHDATIMYLGYFAAYTGLLFYQYNRIFTGTLALPDLLIAAALGFMIGPLLKHFLPLYPYWGVSALGVSTWTAALLSLRTAKVGWFTPSEKWKLPVAQSQYFCSDGLGSEVVSSQTDLQTLYRDVCGIQSDHRFEVIPSVHPGVEVKAYLTPSEKAFIPDLVKSAFPAMEEIMEQVLSMWDRSSLTVELVSATELSHEGQKLAYIARLSQQGLHLFIPILSELSGNGMVRTVQKNCKIIAETLLQAYCECILGLPRDHAVLAQLLIGNEPEERDLHLSKTMTQYLRNYPDEYPNITAGCEKKLLGYTTLTVDCDKEWDVMPREMRLFFLQRSLGLTCTIDHSCLTWISTKFNTRNSVEMQDYINRCNLGATIVKLVYDDISALQYRRPARGSVYDRPPSFAAASTFISTPRAQEPRYKHIKRLLPNPFARFYQGMRAAMKFFIVSIVADPDFQRELDYIMSDKPFLLRWPTKVFLNGTWIICKTLQDAVFPTLLIKDRKHFAQLAMVMKGVKVTTGKSKIMIEGSNGVSTCFIRSRADGNLDLHQYSGQHATQPEGIQALSSINTYTHNLVLHERVEYAHSSVVNRYTYDYAHGSKSGGSRIPICRRCVEGSNQDQIVQYDERGYIKSGSYIKDGNFTQFTFWYRDNARFDDELLRAEFVLAHMSIRVSWYVPSPKTPKKLDTAIPYPKVMEAVFTEGESVYRSRWTYDHKSHPVISTTLNGVEIDTPDMIKFDWFDVLKKPTRCNIFNDNPLLLLRSPKPNLITRLLGMNSQWYPISTSLARANLWKSWKSSKDFDAITTRWLDERVLRSDRVLKPYWTARDMGRLSSAEVYLDTYSDTVMARVDIDPDISAWTPFAYKTSDLYTFGTGGDTVINTRKASTQVRDQKNNLHVLAIDTGTFPNEGGGVSACRRDMVNDLKTIRWHLVAESANDFGFPKFQIERNIQSLTILPLWGLDYLTPSHGIFQKHLDSVIQEKSHNTSDDDIRANFIPILTSLVQCARAVKLYPYHIEQATKALLDLNAYFETYRHWSDIWMSDIVKEAWRELWLTEKMENTRPMSQWLEAEHPTIGHLDNALDMWQRYLFVFSLPVPEKIPDVVQASHHFACGSYGIICKLKRGCSFHVWDHCIAWREVTVFLSSAMSFDAPFVCTSLISLSRILGVLQLHYADVVLPCADFFNPGWEVEIGSIEGTLCHRKEFARKIDPVVNGICNMDSFQPIEQITSEKPTAVMLSHVRFVKDIKNAILAADIIINEWGIKDYRLDIYGDMERAPSYATECQEIIAAKNLRDHVILRGLGSPSKVLQKAWLFLNSSVSEGLPLAMGEAALTGVPVVCTDVGASFRVVTDRHTGKAFSAVCPPNDAYSLARAQVSIMGLLGEWAEFADDPPGYPAPQLPLKPTPEEAEAITKRMYEKQEQRRRLGMRGRSNVLENFSSDRYLREHEQMLWIAKYQSQSYRDRVGRKFYGIRDSGAVTTLASGSGSGSGSGTGSRAESDIYLAKPRGSYEPF